MKKKFTSVISKMIIKETKSMLDKDITLSDMHEALQNMKNNKSPGPDGIISEFYKIYWIQLREEILKIFKNGYDTGELSYTQYLALIILLYKKGGQGRHSKLATDFTLKYGHQNIIKSISR